MDYYIRFGIHKKVFNKFLYKDSNLNGYTSSKKIPRPFRLTMDEIPRQPLVSPMYL